MIADLQLTLLYRIRAIFDRTYFRNMLIFKTWLFHISMNFEAHFFKISFNISHFKCIQNKFMAQLYLFKVLLCFGIYKSILEFKESFLCFQGSNGNF